MTILIKSPGYINGDRQQNSNVLANEIVRYLLINCEKTDIDTEMIARILRPLLVNYFGHFDCDDLNKKIAQFDLFKEGRSDMPVQFERWIA